MAIRRVVIWPDESGVVPRGAIQQALIDAEAVVHVAGGVITLTVQRAPEDDAEGNRIVGVRHTTLAVVEWKDRPDARAQEESAQVPAVVSAPPPPAPGMKRLDAEAMALAAEVAADAAQDGIVPPDLASPDAEDDSEIPVALR